MPGRRSGLTLVEVLVVASILALAAVLAIPAVQGARESARRAACQNQLKQVGLALQGHASEKGMLPSLYNGGFLPMPRGARDEFHFHSWRTTLLPYLEAAPVVAALNFALPSTWPANRTAVNVGLAVFVCPSTSNPTRVVPDIREWDPTIFPTNKVGTAARADYEAVGAIQVAPQTKISTHLDCYEFGPWGEPTYNTENGTSIRYRTARLADVSDGLAHTMVLAERGGRPDHYARGRLVRRYQVAAADQMDVSQEAWAISTHFLWVVLHERAAVNADNHGIYSFHPGGAHIALADGSVRFLKDSTTSAVLKALVTRSGAEAVADE